MSERDHQTHARIEEKLAELRVALRETVRREQLVDQLTKLDNDDALNEWIQSQIDAEKRFWLAFVEIDRFKSVNDEFGYDDADELLRRVAGQLENAALHFFAAQAVPFRAHGDEFFVGGWDDDGGVFNALEGLRTTIAALRIRAKSSSKPMTCTVSIGWATSIDVQNSGRDLTRRRVRDILERAVAAAKHDRNKVVRYKPSMEKSDVRDGRADCGGCHSKFTVSTPIDDRLSAALFCPNCGKSVPRPPSLLASIEQHHEEKAPTPDSASVSKPSLEPEMTEKALTTA